MTPTNTLRKKIEDIVYEEDEVGERTINQLLTLFKEEMLKIIGEDELDMSTPRMIDISSIKNNLRQELRDTVQKL